MTPHRRRRALSLEELDLWLASDQAPAKGGWNVSVADGFLAGIVVGPEPIKPKEWTRLIFGARPLGKDGDAAIQAVLDRHDATAKALAEAPARYALRFMRTDEGVVLAQDWAAGFLAAVRLRLTGGVGQKGARAASASTWDGTGAFSATKVSTASSRPRKPSAGSIIGSTSTKR